MISMLNAAKIKGLRLAKKLSLRGLCSVAKGEISPSHLSELEQGKVANPTKRVTRAIAK